MYGAWFSCLVVCSLIVLVLCHLLYILVFYRGHCKCSLSLVGPVRMLWFCFYYLLLQTNKVMMMIIRYGASSSKKVGSDKLFYYYKNYRMFGINYNKLQTLDRINIKTMQIVA